MVVFLLLAWFAPVVWPPLEPLFTAAPVFLEEERPYGERFETKTDALFLILLVVLIGGGATECLGTDPIGPMH